MTIPIYSDQSNQLNTNDIRVLDGCDQLKSCLEEASKKVAIEKKRRPEDVIPTLAQMAQIAWDQQPNQFRAFIENNVDSHCLLSQVVNETRSDHITQDDRNQSRDAAPSKAQLIDSADNFSMGSSSIRLNEIKSATADQIPKTLSSKHDDAIKDLSKIDISAEHVESPAGYQSADLSQSFLDTPLRFERVDSGAPTTAHNKASPQKNSHSPNSMPAHGLDVLAGSASSVNEIGSNPKLKAEFDSSQTDFEKYRDTKKFNDDSGAISEASLAVMSHVHNSSDVVVTSLPQQAWSGPNTRRSTNKSGVELGTQNKTVEGINYKFTSWGSGNNSVQITGSAKYGYNALSSNGDVSSVLEKYLPEDGSLPLTITSSANITPSTQENLVQSLGATYEQRKE